MASDQNFKSLCEPYCGALSKESLSNCLKRGSDSPEFLILPNDWRRDAILKMMMEPATPSHKDPE